MCVCVLEYYSAVKENEIMPFAAIWMDIEILVLSEVSQTEISESQLGEMSYDIPYMWNLKRNDTNDLTYKPETDLREFMVAGGKDRAGRDSQGVWDGRGHTAVFNKENQQGPAVHPRDLCSMSCGSLDGTGVWGRMGTCVRVAESIHCPPEAITTLFINSTSKQNESLKQE